MKNTGWRVFAGLVVACTALVGAGTAHAEGRRVALLVGVGEYEDLRYRLEGPPHDVAAMRDVLVRRWGFQAQDVRMLVDGQATREAILSELQALERRSGAGDEVLIYFSGHGTSALDREFDAPVPYGSGAFVPYGFLTGKGEPVSRLIVGRGDLLPRLQALERGGRRLWVIADACYSGTFVRSVKPITGPQLASRLMPMAATNTAVHRERVRPELTDSEPYPYRSTVFLSAAAEGEIARDIKRVNLGAMPTLDGKPHGAMTDALLRVLEGQLPADVNRDGTLDLNEAHRAVSDFMASRPYGHTPQRLPGIAEDVQGLGSRPVLAVRGAARPATGDVAATPLEVQTDNLDAALQRAIVAIPGVRRSAPGSLRFDLVALVMNGTLELSTAGGDVITSVPLSETGRITAQVAQLAWAKRLRTLAERHRRAVLQVQVLPKAEGGNMRLGQKVAFVVQPDKPGPLLLLNIDSEGKVSVLYPAHRHQLRSLKANEAAFIPGKDPDDLIDVRLPLGMDIQFVFAFDDMPAGLDSLMDLTRVDVSDSRLRTLERLLPAMSGRFAFASTELRTNEK